METVGGKIGVQSPDCGITSQDLLAAEGRQLYPSCYLLYLFLYGDFKLIIRSTCSSDNLESSVQYTIVFPCPADVIAV